MPFVEDCPAQAPVRFQSTASGPAVVCLPMNIVQNIRIKMLVTIPAACMSPVRVQRTPAMDSRLFGGRCRDRRWDRPRPIEARRPCGTSRSHCPAPGINGLSTDQATFSSVSVTAPSRKIRQFVQRRAGCRTHPGTRGSGDKAPFYPLPPPSLPLPLPSSAMRSQHRPHRASDRFPSFTLVLLQHRDAMQALRRKTAQATAHPYRYHPYARAQVTRRRLSDVFMHTIDYREESPVLRPIDRDVDMDSVSTLSLSVDLNRDEDVQSLEQAVHSVGSVSELPSGAGRNMRRRTSLSSLVIDLALAFARKCRLN